MTAINVNLKELHAAVRTHAAALGIPMSEYIRQSCARNMTEGASADSIRALIRATAHPLTRGLDTDTE
jgi:hypothetical protein